MQQALRGSSTGVFVSRTLSYKAWNEAKSSADDHAEKLLEVLAWLVRGVVRRVSIQEMIESSSKYCQTAAVVRLRRDRSFHRLRMIWNEGLTPTATLMLGALCDHGEAHTHTCE